MTGNKRSNLQYAQSAIVWQIKYRLQHCSYHIAGLHRDFKLSEATVALIDEHNKVTDALRASFKADYDAYAKQNRKRK